MKRILPALALLLAALPATAATARPFGGDEVGVGEKLGATVPLDLVLHDERGNAVTLGSLIDKPTVLTLNYFRCASICTPQLNNLLRTLNEVALEPGRDFQVVTVSFDPRDTWEMAAKKRQNYLSQMKRPFPPSAWRFLTGDEKATRTLADSVGFWFRREGSEFMHPGVLMVLSPGGKITRYMYGISYLPFDLEMALSEATRGLARPSIARILDYCYSWDPQGRRYAFSMIRVIGAAMIVMAAIFLGVVIVKGRRKA